MKTPVYDGDEGKISPSCPTRDTTESVAPLSENAVLSRVILPEKLRDCFSICPVNGDLLWVPEELMLLAQKGFSSNDL